MAKGYQRPQCVEDNGSADNPIHVEFTEKFHGRDPTLIVFENVILSDSSSAQSGRSRANIVVTYLHACSDVF
jgi:hypothetical protein